MASTTLTARPLTEGARATASSVLSAPLTAHPEVVGLLLLGLALAFNAILLAPEARIERVPVNDLIFHVAASQRLGESITHGEPFLDPWVSQWSLGFPLWRVYQPLPHLLAAAVIGLARPFASAAASFAALYYVLLVLLPASFYLGARLIGLNPIAAGLGSILVLAPSEAEDFARYGMSFGAHVWRGSGLFTELVALELLFPALGLAARAIDTGRRETTAGMALALTALSHIFFGYIAFVSIAIWAMVSPAEGRSRRIVRAASIAARAALLLAWFIIPMILAGGEVNRSRWDPGYKFDSYGAPVILAELFSGRLLDFGRAPVLSLIVAAAALAAAFNLKNLLARRLLALTGLWLVLYFGRETWGHLMVLAGVPSQFHLHRLEAAFELFAIMLAAWGLERIAVVAFRAHWLVCLGVIAMIAVATVVIGAERLDYLRLNALWGESNLAAFERERGDLESALSDVREIVAERPGRVSAGKAADWGGTFTIGDAPVYSFLTRSGFDEASFLYHTMSLSSDYIVLRDENDMDHENLFGIRAILAPSELKLPRYFRKRSVHGRFAVYEASPRGYFTLVDIGARYDGAATTWFDPVSRWMQSRMLRFGEVIALDSHLRTVPSIGRWQELPEPTAEFRQRPGLTLAESKTGETYRATIAAARSCYALIKITYFPDLTAWVDGQRTQKIRVSPDFVAIPIASGEHEVEVRYEPGPVKPLLLVIGIALFAIAASRVAKSALKTVEERLTARLKVLGGWLTTDRVKLACAIALLILLFTRALFRGQLLSGHDALEYPPRLTEFAAIVGDHSLPPVWAPDLGSGHGQPLFEFAPPLTYVMALPFFKCGMSLADSLQFGLAILFALGAIAVYRLGRRASFPQIACVGGAAAWLFAPYQSLDVYVAARFAESSGLAMAPVALLGLVKALECRTPISIALGSAAVALVPLGHNAVALLMFPAFALLVLARSAISERPFRTAAAGAAVIGAGLALSAFFWLPALTEKDFVQTDLLRTDFLNWTVHIISPWQLIWSPWGYGYSVAGPNDGISFSLGLVHLMLAIAGTFIALRAVDRGRRVDAMVFAGAALAAALLSTEWSSPVWARVSTLQYLAYPWRTLCVPALFMPLLALYVFERVGSKATILLIALIVAVNLPHTQPKGYETFDDEYFYPTSIAQKGLNTTTREEYEPRWVQMRPPYTAEHLIGLGAPSPDVRDVSYDSKKHVYSVKTPVAMKVTESTFYYPGWTVMIDGHEAGILPEPVSGLISFEVPAGQHTITVELRQTSMRRLGLVISLVTLVGLMSVVSIAWVLFRRRRPILSAASIEAPLS